MLGIVPDVATRGWTIPIGGAENKENTRHILERFVKRSWKQIAKELELSSSSVPSFAARGPFEAGEGTAPARAPELGGPIRAEGSVRVAPEGDA